MPDGAQPQTNLTEHRFGLLVNAITDYAIYMLDPGGIIASWNPGAQRFKGYEADEVLGRHFEIFFTEEDRTAGAPARALATAAAEGRFEAEGWRLRKDGTRFWANAVLDAIRAADGTLLGFAKVTRDITERRAAERALYDSEQRFRLLVQGVRDYAIYMLDAEGRITNWNAGAEAIKGYRAEEVVGSHFSRFYTEEDRAAGEPARTLATALAEGKFETEAWRVRKDGTRFFAHVIIDPILDDEGGFAGFAKITRDITERRQAQQALEQARISLFQAQKLQALGELTGGIAHDFNNLMTVIRGSAELLSTENLSSTKRQRYLDAIMETVDRASDLTGHLLAFGRRQSLNPRRIDLNLRLDALGEVLSRTLDARIAVRLDLADDLWPVDADDAQLETALLNAAFNARDAMPDGGVLTLATANRPAAEGAGDSVSLSVSDTGSGMPPEILSRVFEPFFTTKPIGKGTGLGLSQIHGFAAQSGGRAEIESEAGVGTTVRLILPRSTEPADIATASGSELCLMPAGRSILLVEDNDNVRDFAGDLLEQMGFRVTSANSAEDGWAKLQEEQPDVLFSDIVMPGCGGIALARMALERWPDLPILLATGYSAEIAGGNADGFVIVAKPYSRETLTRALAGLLSG
ncbi:PAS domain S-box-containing protein [Sphingomonas zeicaulis]|uniref:hybrid sensor histidine kinase/response regulator n=1 Tax=Sphingomonas zeicaulis TaxID=1632740 RepID=UPI003D239B44